jgi:NitT/TauT family transport system ATP-binding protein
MGEPAPVTAAELVGGTANATPALEIVALGKTFVARERESVAIREVSFTVSEREFVAVVGPSGCGKTTLLKCIAGLTHPSSGQSRFQGKQVSGPMIDMALVFQDYSRSLFPWLTVRKNILLPLRGRTREGREDVVQESLDAVGLLSYIDHYPWQLSGGMQQRVAIARALACQPRVLLMDEPFASVDAQTRAELEDLVLRIHAEFGVTMLLVTHDIDESVYMSDRVIILSSSPSYVQEVLAIDLPRPRAQDVTKALPEFASLRTHVYRAITKAHSDRRGLLAAESAAQSVSSIPQGGRKFWGR